MRVSDSFRTPLSNKECRRAHPW